MRVFILEYYDDVAESHSVEGVFESPTPALRVVEERWAKQYWNTPPTPVIIRYWLKNYWVSEWEVGGWAPTSCHDFLMQADGRLGTQRRGA